MEYNIAFAKLEYVLPFLHICATIGFGGAWLGLYFLGRSLLKQEDSHNHELFLRLCRPFWACGIVCGILVMVCGWSIRLFQDVSLEISDPMAVGILATKVALWLFLAVNTVYMFYHYTRALKFFKLKDSIQTHESLVLVVYYFAPLNLIIIALSSYLGVAYRSFV